MKMNITNNVVKSSKVVLTAALVILLICPLSGCSNRLKEKLGVIERGPDEFTVITYPELEVPSDLHSLPKPSSGHNHRHAGRHLGKYYTETNDIDSAIFNFENNPPSSSSMDEHDASFIQELN